MATSEANRPPLLAGATDRVASKRLPVVARGRRPGRLLRPLPVAVVFSGLLHALSLAGAVGATGGPGLAAGVRGLPTEPDPTFDVDVVDVDEPDPSRPPVVPASAVDEAETDDPWAAQGPNAANGRPITLEPAREAREPSSAAPERASPARTPRRAEDEPRPRRAELPNPASVPRGTAGTDDSLPTTQDGEDRRVAARPAKDPNDHAAPTAPEAPEPGSTHASRTGAARPDTPPAPSDATAALPAPSAASEPSRTAAARGSAPAGAAALGGGGGRKGIRPDLFERFNHDLPSVAYGVDGWGACRAGDEVALTVTLELDADGKVVRCPLAADGADRCRAPWLVEGAEACRSSSALDESVRRTIGGLYGRFRLPDAQPGPGAVALRVTASVRSANVGTAGPASPSEPPVIVGSTPRAGNEAKGHFQRRGERRIDFTVKLLRVEGAPATGADAPGAEPSGGSGAN